MKDYPVLRRRLDDPNTAPDQDNQALKPIILTQPAALMVSVGTAEAVFSVEAAGEALSYQWQYRPTSVSEWKYSTMNGHDTQTLKVKASTNRNGYEYRCVIRNGYGNTYSRAAALTFNTRKCGEKLHWTLNSDGLLTVYGVGAMKTYRRFSFWYDIGVAGQIKTAMLAEGVKDLGGYSFYGCSALSKVRLPNSVTSIGAAAFFGCVNLSDILIPDSVTAIGHLTFYNCKALTSITIPDSVTVVGDGAFCGCSALASVTIPDSVTKLGNGLFDRCSSLSDVYFKGTEEQWSAIASQANSEPLTKATVHFVA